MRALVTLISIVIVAVLAVVVALQPGHVEIAWRDWRLAPSVPVAIAALVVLTLGVALLAGLFHRLVTGPRAYLKARRERRRQAGYRALTQGMVAVAAGDAEEAQRQARKADVLLAEPPLTLLLSAQAAQLGGDETAARKYFTEMLNRQETEFLGLRGLLLQALRAGDDATALRLVERARSLRPKTPWVLTNLLTLQTRAQRWDEAQATLGEATKAKLIEGPRAQRQQAVLLTERSREAEARGDLTAALQLAGKAQDLAPDLAPAAARRAALLHQAGRNRAAAKVIETAWRRAPHPLLAETYETLYAEEPPLVRVNRFEGLAATNPDHIESHIAVARAALTAQLWGEARRHIEAAGATDDALHGIFPGTLPGTLPRTLEGAGEHPGAAPPARLCRLRAELDAAQHGDTAAARAWLARAALAPPDPLYLCSECGAESLTFEATCPRCRAFATLDWRIPSRAAPSLTDTGATAPRLLPATSSIAGTATTTAGTTAAPLTVDAARA